MRKTVFVSVHQTILEIWMKAVDGIDFSVFFILFLCCVGLKIGRIVTLQGYWILYVCVGVHVCVCVWMNCFSIANSTDGVVLYCSLYQ